MFRSFSFRFLFFVIFLFFLIPFPGAYAAPESRSGNNGGGWLESHGLAVRPISLLSGGRIWFLYGASPGSRIIDTVEFWNRRKESVRVAVEAVDAELIEGAFALKSPNKPGIFIAKWVNFLNVTSSHESVVEVPVGGRKTFSFAMKIPLDAKYRDYWGGVTVREIVPHGSSWRVGIRMLIRLHAADSSTTQYLPQVGGGVFYAPEATLFLQDLFDRLTREFSLFSALPSFPFFRSSPAQLRSAQSDRR